MTCSNGFLVIISSGKCFVVSNGTRAHPGPANLQLPQRLSLNASLGNVTLVEFGVALIYRVPICYAILPCSIETDHLFGQKRALRSVHTMTVTVRAANAGPTSIFPG